MSHKNITTKIITNLSFKLIIYERGIFFYMKFDYFHLWFLNNIFFEEIKLIKIHQNLLKLCNGDFFL